MTSISKVLVQQTRLQIFQCKTNTQIDLKGWLTNQNYFIDSPLARDNHKLRPYREENLQEALANDCNRMASAAIESISGIQPDKIFKRSLAWGVIRTYYGAFFAAHSIMRMYGVSCSQLDNEHISKILESARHFDQITQETKLDKGFYAIEVSPNFKEVILRKLKDSHRDTWSEFLSLVKKLAIQSENATALIAERTEVIDILNSIKKGISRSHCSNKGNWLSHIRNSVNYQHTHGVWFPYTKRTTAKTTIETASRNWIKPETIKPIESSNDDIEFFFQVSTMINSLFRELLVSCVSRAGLRKSRFSQGSLNLLNNVKSK